MLHRYEYKARVTDVYDGDTVTLDIDVGFGIWLKGQKARLYGINTPEIRTKDSVEKAKGIAVRNYVRRLVLNKKVIIRTAKDSQGKFGRWLITIFYKHRDKGYKNLNTELYDEKLAKKYLIDKHADIMLGDL